MALIADAWKLLVVSFQLSLWREVGFFIIFEVTK